MIGVENQMVEFGVVDAFIEIFFNIALPPSVVPVDKLTGGFLG